MDAKLLKVLDESLSPEDEAAFEAALADAMPNEEVPEKEDAASATAANEEERRGDAMSTENAND